MNTRLNPILVMLALAGALAFPAAAQQATAPQAAPGAAAAQAPADFADGEVRKVDKSAGKITLRHGEIRSLDMPPMTMAFAVADKALLDKVKPGDKVRFRAADRDGRLTVTEIEAAK